jgi:hypothetical protein
VNGQDQWCIDEVSAIPVSGIIEEESIIEVSGLAIGDASGSDPCLFPQPTTASAMVRDRTATKAIATNLRILVSHLLLIPRPSERFPERITGVDLSHLLRHHSEAVFGLAVPSLLIGFAATPAMRRQTGR